MIFRSLPPKFLHSVWDEVRQGLEAIKSEGGEGWKLEDVYAALRSDRASLFFAFENDGDAKPVGFYILEMLEAQFTAENYICVWCLFAEKDGNALAFRDEFIAEVERIAKARGCTQIRLYGRRGWERVLKGLFEVMHVVYVRKVK